MKKSLILVLIFSLIASCSLFKSGKKPYPEGLVFPIKKAGEVPYRGEIVDSISREGSRLYFASRSGSVYCIDGEIAEKTWDPETGKSLQSFVFPGWRGRIILANPVRQEVVWEFRAPSPFKSPVYLGEMTVCAVAEDDTLFCLDKQGRLLWKKTSPQEITTPIAETGNRVHFGTGGGDVFSVSAETGEEIWVFRAAGAIRTNIVSAEGLVIFGCDDRKIYFLDEQGTPAGAFDLPGRIGRSLAVSQDRLYFGTDDQAFQSLDILLKRIDWTIGIGGEVVVPPLIVGKKILFLGTNNVLYCLNKNNGNILWWRPLPSRAAYQVEVVDEYVLATSMSSRVVCIDLDSGDWVNAFQAEEEVRSNPLWLKPYLLINIYNDRSGAGRLQYFDKLVSIELKSSRPSPQPKAEEITFTCTSSGLFEPEYEFSLKRLLPVHFGLGLRIFIPAEPEEEIVQEKSDKNSWAWVPSDEGLYLIGAKAADVKEEVETRVLYIITREENIAWRWWIAHQERKRSSIFKGIDWESPVTLNQSGPVTKIFVRKENAEVVYAATSGGIWKTANNGTTWKPLFEDQPTLFVSDIAFSVRNRDLIWAGTGDNGVAEFSRPGAGVFKSSDRGRTWTSMGLREAYNIGRILIHPENDDVVLVAAMGNLHNPGEERGIFRTGDGGITWEKVLFVDRNTGFIDIVMDPEFPETLHAAAWQFSRSPGRYTPGGKRSGVYSSTDGGKTWAQPDGLPKGDHVGRIDLALAPAQPNRLYAAVGIHQPPKLRESQTKKKYRSGLDPDDLEEMTAKDFLELKPEKIRMFLEDYEAPPLVTPQNLLLRVEKGELTPQGMAEAFKQLDQDFRFERFVEVEVYMSPDRGINWERVNQRPLSFPIKGVDFSGVSILVDPRDADRLFLMGPALLVSRDGGKSFAVVDGGAGEGAWRCLWIDPEQPARMLGGRETGLSLSYDGGRAWQSISNLPLGSILAIAGEGKKTHDIHLGVKGRGYFEGSVNPSGSSSRIWEEIMPEDVSHIQEDPDDRDTVYLSSTSGILFRLDKRGKTWRDIRPVPGFGEPPPRYGRSNPILISPHNRLILYFGANRVFKSYDGGEKWYSISQDLTMNPEPGNVPYGGIVCLAESPLFPGLVYAGTDDGLVWITRNGGGTWDRIVEGLPGNIGIAHIEPSLRGEGVVYICLDGSMAGDLTRHVYISGDFGETWAPIANNLGSGPVLVVREDPWNPNVVYAGTFKGIYISTNRGSQWWPLGGNLPVVPVAEIFFDLDSKDLYAGTRGRGLFRMEGRVISEIPSAVRSEKHRLFPVGPVDLEDYAGNASKILKIYFYLQSAARGSLYIADSEGSAVKEFSVRGGAGFHEVSWNLDLGEEGLIPRLLDPGEYRVILEVGDVKLEEPLLVRTGSS